VTGSLKPWREVVMPHEDVASGRYQQAEFAADLWQVHLGEGTDEYRDPVEFFRRTYLTESLKGMLVGAVRASPRGAATRWCSCRPTSAAARRTRCWRSTTCFPASRRPNWLASTRDGPAETSTGYRRPRRVVLVGNKISPGNPSTKPTARWCARCGANWPGSLAARRRLRGSQPTMKGDQPRRRAARAVQRIRPVPDPDRRVGGLCAPAARPERPAGRRLRDAIHLRPGADRIGQAGEELPAGDQPAGLGYLRLTCHTRRP
jgi:hypothetical protein